MSYIELDSLNTFTDAEHLKGTRKQAVASDFDK
jgi:hypothetical protein